MTKQLTRQEVEAVVNRLADKTLKKGCVFTWNHDWWTVNFIDLSDRIFAFSLSGDIHDLPYVNQERRWEYKYHMFTQDSDDWHYVEVLGHPITIGTVLEKMQGATNSFAKVNYEHEVERLCQYWMACGFSKSLQQIVDESGYMIYTDLEYAELMLLKSPEANALFSFLQEIL